MNLQDLKAKVESAFQKMLEEQTHESMVNHWQAVVELDNAEKWTPEPVVLRSELGRRAEDRA